MAAATSFVAAFSAPAVSTKLSRSSRTSNGASSSPSAFLERSFSSSGCSSSGKQEHRWQQWALESATLKPSSVQRSLKRSLKGACWRQRQQVSISAVLVTDEDLRRSGGSLEKEFDLTLGTLPSEGFTGAPFSLDSTPYAVDMGAAGLLANQVGGKVLATVAPYRPKLLWFTRSEEEEKEMLNTAVNGALVAFASSVVVTKVLTVDHDYWTGWTLSEILRNVPRDNWHAYENFLAVNPVLAKMMTSGIVYALGDWSAQCYQGRPFLSFYRLRMLRSGLVGFCLHGSLSHHYYHFCEWLFPSKDWWVVPAKVAFDQTIWSGIWNSIYYVTLGLLRAEHPGNIWRELRGTFFPLLTAGWKLWPFAHIVTYGFVPVEQRLLWVDMVELIWVTVLSMMANEKAEARREDEEYTQESAEELAQTAIGVSLICNGKEELMDSIFWPAEMEGQEYVIADGRKADEVVN